MKEKERLLVTGLVMLMLVLWLGFPWHQSPRFAGSFWGGVLGVVGALLMLVPLAYMVVKRSKRLKKKVSHWVSMRTLLAWHIYAGVLGPILVILHTGHKYESPLGIALTAMTLLVVVSGFIGRYLMNQFSQEIREKKAMLTTLQAAYQQAATNLAGVPEQAKLLQPFSGFFSRLIASALLRDPATHPVNLDTGVPSAATLLRLSDSIADVEYAMRTHEKFKLWFGKWLKFHIVISIVLYVLMALHIWAAVHFGLRWFDSWSASASYFTRSASQSSEPVNLLTTLPEKSAARESNEPVEQFSRHFGQLFKQHWHAPVLIHGIRTTVFDYAGLANGVGRPESNFSQALLALQRVSPEHLGGGSREKAFWINVYNFGAMRLAAENYPVRSITDSKISTGDPWAIQSVRVGTKRYTLQQIENEILLKRFPDPRVVFAVSCAAVSCPDRMNWIFSGDRLDAQLEDIVSRFLTNPTKGLAINQQSNLVKLSWILHADRRLFGNGSDQDLLHFVGRYTSEENRDWIDANRGKINIQFFEHDWGLNDVALADSDD